MEKLVGLIPAAGKGVRAQPYTREMHKGLLDVNGTPNMERIVAIMRDQLHIQDIVIVVGHLGDTIRDHFGDGSRFGVAITYVQNNDLDKGLAWSILLAKPYIQSHFCIMLCDECYISSNHHALLSAPWHQHLFIAAGLRVDDNQLIRKNYAINQQNHHITALQEKPTVIQNDIMGSGTFICDPALFDFLEEAYQKNPGYVEFVSLLDALVKQGQSAFYFELTGTYVNINDRDSLHAANYHDRDRHFSSYSKGLLVYSEGDEENIVFTIERYKELPDISAIYVVVPAQNSIAVLAAKTGVTVIVCPPDIKHYGEKLHFALQKMPEDILIITEADYSFSSRDVAKLFAYLRDADMVIGTRTTRQLIEQGSTMQGVARLANAFLGKLLEVLWWEREGRFTDVGCTFRAFWKTSFQTIAPHLQNRGPEYSAEMVIEALNARQRVIEIPVNYYNRSQSLQRAYRNYQTFFAVLSLLFRKRIRKLFQ